MPKAITEHIPQVAWFRRHIVVTVVGCGGTGAQVAMGLPYLNQALLADGHPYGLRVCLVDGNRITERTVSGSLLLAQRSAFTKWWSLSTA